MEPQYREASDVELVEIGIERRADLRQPHSIPNHEDDVGRVVPGYWLGRVGAGLRPAVNAPAEAEGKESIFG